MDKTEQKKLVRELSVRIEKAKKSKGALNFYNSKIFVISEDYITDSEFSQMEELFCFIRKNEHLSNDEIYSIMKKKPLLFRTLRKFVKDVPDFIQTLRMHGYGYAAARYAKIKEVETDLRKG